MVLAQRGEARLGTVFRQSRLCWWMVKKLLPRAPIVDKFRPESGEGPPERVGEACLTPT